MNKLSKAGMSRLGPVFKNGLIIAATYLLLAGLLVIGITPEQHDIQIGSPAPLDILASKDIVDTVRTEERRAAAAAAVEPSYKSIDFSVVGSVSSEMQAIFDTLFALRDSEWPDPDRITEDELSALNASLPVNLSPEEYRALRTSDVDNLRHLFEDATGRQANRLAESGDLGEESLKTLTLADLGLGEKKADVRAPTVEEVLAELDALVGLKPVKDEVRRLVATVRANRMRAEKGLENNVTMSYNFVFTGNPGTGKTTVARILGKAFRALGVLDRANFVETDRSRLVAKYEGQTAAKTNKLIDSAMGGILFIDEAYQLNQGENDQYGSEAVATLLKRMEDSRGSMVVIIAGYSEEMKRFMDINSGLASRFNRTIEFPDYSAKELADVFRSMAKKAKYRLSDDVEHWLVPYVSMLTEKRDKNFGNARWARNLFEKSVERQALRVTELGDPSAEELMTLRLSDLGVKLKDPAASDED